MIQIDLYDTFVLIGQIHAGTQIGARSGKSPRELKASICRCLEHDGKGIPQVFQANGIAVDFTEWPPPGPDELSKFFRAMDRSLRSGDPGLEAYWRVATSLGYVLWTPVTPEGLELVGAALREIGISEVDVVACLLELESSDQMKRIEAVESVRTLLRKQASDSQSTKLPPELGNFDIAGAVAWLPRDHEDLAKAVMLTYEEAFTCFKAGLNLACIALSGRVLETIMHYALLVGTGINADEEGLGFNAIRSRLKKAGYAYDENVTKQYDLIMSYRNKAVHGGVSMPTAREALAILLLVQSVLSKAEHTRPLS